VAQGLVKKGIKAASVWYQGETYIIADSDSRCECCCGWRHIEDRCSNTSKCGYCSCRHQTRDCKCNIARCTAIQGSLSGYTLEKCPNCKGKHIAFSNRCIKKAEAAGAALQSRMIGQAGWAFMNATTDAASRTN